SYGNYIKKIYERVRKIIGDDYDIVEICEYSMNKESLYTHLTGRQLEIAVYAASRGYFNTPKEISTAEIAETFGITSSAVTEQMRKIKKEIFEKLFK
ncbi:MAG: hypothetical protein EU521_01115, partial [Promethearchaeota archaeon]